MKIRNYIHTFSFRTGLILFLGLSLTLIILRTLVYIQSVDTAYADIREILRAHQEEISEGMDTYGSIYVKDLVETVTQQTEDRFLIIAFNDDGKISGNLDEWPDFKPEHGWQETNTRRDDDSPLHLYGKIVIYPDQSRLLIGYDLTKVDTLKNTLLHSLLWNTALSFLLAFALSALVVLVLNRHLAKINNACQHVMGGDMGYRIKVSSQFDQFDRLSGNINKMLDWIHALLETVKDSSNAMAHDLRTPLSRHRLELRALSENPDLPAALKKDMRNSIERVDTLIELFDNILNIAKAESRSSTELFETVGLSALVSNILDFYDPLLEERRITLTRSIPDEELSILGDKQLLSQAVMNLIDNAVKYIPEGSNITISLSSMPEQIWLQVADNGPGIPEEFLEKAKQRFFRIDESRHSIGTGLGLSLVNAVAKLHQGELILENNVPGLKVTLIFHLNGSTHV